MPPGSFPQFVYRQGQFFVHMRFIALTILSGKTRDKKSATLDCLLYRAAPASAWLNVGAVQPHGYASVL
jgi:hypothetical protein